MGNELKKRTSTSPFLMSLLKMTRLLDQEDFRVVQNATSYHTAPVPQ